jgi:transposase
MAENPDGFRDRRPEICEQCGGRFGPDAAEELIDEYDEIEIPPVKPYIIRHRSYACRCSRCGLPSEAPAPAIAGKTPFGPRIHALAIYYKTFQALSCERLRFMFRAAFGLQVSERALMNMFARARPRFACEADKARCAPSRGPGRRQRRSRRAHRGDQFLSMGVPLQGRRRSSARLFPRRPRGRRGDGRAHVPQVWISNRYAAQQSHGRRRQTCLAHLARDTAFALEHGSDDLPLWFKLWFDSAFDPARAIPDRTASTIAAKKRLLEKRLAELLTVKTGCTLAQKLQAKIARARHQLLTFCDCPGEVDATNNGSERKLRPCVIQRKVTNGYRAMWAAQAEKPTSEPPSTPQGSTAPPRSTSSPPYWPDTR